MQVVNRTPKIKDFKYIERTNTEDKDRFINPINSYFTPIIKKKKTFRLKSKSKNKTDSTNKSNSKHLSTKFSMTNKIKTSPSEVQDFEFSSDKKFSKLKLKKFKNKLSKNFQKLLRNDYDSKIKAEMNKKYEKDFILIKKTDYPNTDTDWELEERKRKLFNNHSIKAIKKNLIYELFEEGKWYYFDIRLFTFIYFRMRVKNKKRPLTISFKSEQDFSFKLFGVNKGNYPDETNCDYSFNLNINANEVYKFSILIGRDSIPEFIYPYFSFSLFPLVNIDQLFIKFNFPENEIIKYNVAKKNKQIMTNVTYRDDKTIFSEMALILEKRRKTYHELKTKNQENKLSEEKRKLNTIGFESKIQQIFSRKNKHEEEVMKRKMYLNYKSDVKQKLKEIDQTENIKNLRFQNFTKSWIKIIRVIEFIGTFGPQTFQRLKNIKKIRYMMIFVTRIICKMLILVKKKAPNIELRANIDSYLAFTSLGRFSYRKVKVRSTIVMIKFLRSSAEYFRKLRKVKKILSKVNLIPTKIKRFLWKKARYRILIEKIWERYFIIMYTQVLKQKYSELNKVALIPINKSKADKFKQEFIEFHMKERFVTFKSEIKDYMGRVRKINLEFTNKLLMRRDSMTLHLGELEKKKKELKKPRLWKIIDSKKVFEFIEEKFKGVDKFDEAINLE